MENVLLARVDDRLIHGQVMTAWMKLLPAKEIIVIDNKVAKDEFMITVLEMAAPTGVKVKSIYRRKSSRSITSRIKQTNNSSCKITSFIQRNNRSWSRT